MKAKAYADGIDMYCLPILWPLDSKIGELRRLLELVPGDVASPLRSLGEGVLRDLSTTIQGEYFSPSNTKLGTKCAVGKNSAFSAQYEFHCKKDKLPGSNSIMLSTIHDIGFPEQCTDILILLIDDLATALKEKVDKYYRVWSAPGSAMLVSSTTLRSFNAFGYHVKVPHAMLFM